MAGRPDVQLDDDIFGDSEEEKSLPAPSLDLRDVAGGVSLTWLAQVFRKDKNNVKKLLAECPVHRYAASNVPLFDLPTAAAYLVPPKVNVAEYIRKMDYRKWPVHLQKEYWAGQASRQKFLLGAGELWHTKDVFSVFTNTFQIIKSQMRLWPASLRETTGLTDAQQKTVERLIDSMQEDLRVALLEAPKEHKTPSFAQDDGIDDGGEAAEDDV